MKIMRLSFYYIYLILLLVACSSQLPSTANVQVVTAIPTLDGSNSDALCSAVETNWGSDWITTTRALERLYEIDALCEDGLAITSRLYTAYLAYGTQLEQEGRESEAQTAYAAALEYNPQGEEAARRFDRLNIATPEPLERCEQSEVIETRQTLPDYSPATGNFIQIQGSSFVLEDEPFPVYGLNYYPRDTPFTRFLTETELDVFSAELDIVKKTGINTLRMFLRYDDLFICPGNGAVPNVDNVFRLDSMIHIMAEKGFRVIFVLHQDADLASNSLYENPRHISEQTRFIVERYQNEPTILAWDLRDRGDLDYREGGYSSETVLSWLSQTAMAVRQFDSNHLITAGWWEDALATAPLVDFVSFQHYGEYEPLRQRIALLKSQVDKPILLTAIGYSTFNIDETAQRNLLFQAFEEVRSNGLAGWGIYMAFDYPLTATCIEPDCPGEASEINFYGIWNTSYFPKLALDAVKRTTGVEDE